MQRHSLFGLPGLDSDLVRAAWCTRVDLVFAEQGGLAVLASVEAQGTRIKLEVAAQQRPEGVPSA